MRETAEETALSVEAVAELAAVTYDYGGTVVEIHPVVCEVSGDAGRKTADWLVAGSRSYSSSSRSG